MQYIMSLFFAFLAGIALPVQGGANAELSRVLGNPITASLVSAVVGIMLMIILIAIFNAPLPNSTIFNVPWWAWLGGAMGVTFLVLGTFSIPIIGAANFLTIVVAGQVISALIIDKFGLLNIPVHIISATRITGVFMIIAGAIFINIK